MGLRRTPLESASGALPAHPGLALTRTNAMRRTFVEDLDEKATPWGQNPEQLSDSERKENRVRYLLQEARKDALQQEFAHLYREATLISALRKKVHEEAPHSAWIGGIDSEKMEMRYAILIEAPARLIELMEADRNTFMTNIPMWESIDREQRLELIERFSLSPAFADVDRVDPFDLLPPASKDWILGWQREINSGSAYTVSETIGQSADRLIEHGYAMAAVNTVVHAPTEYVGEFEQPGRDDLMPGAPGTPAFVRAMMGERYLEWLLAQEKDRDGT
jgi:hypothetical protein